MPGHAVDLEPAERRDRRVVGLQALNAAMSTRATTRPTSALGEDRRPAPRPRATRARAHRRTAGDACIHRSCWRRTARARTMNSSMTAIAPAPLGAEFFLAARVTPARCGCSSSTTTTTSSCLSLWRRPGVHRQLPALAIEEVPILIESPPAAGLDAAYDAVPLSLAPAALRLATRYLGKSLERRYRPIVDPIRNPYAPGAGQRPPELAGRDRELQPSTSSSSGSPAAGPSARMVLSGLRGVGKTVLLNALRWRRSARGWGTGKIEARPDQSLRRPFAAALHLAVRELAAPHRDHERIEHVARGAQGLRAARAPPGAKGAQPVAARHRRPGRRPAAPTPATSRSTWSSCSPTSAALGGRRSATASRCSSTRCRTSPPTTCRRCARACHEISQQGAPLIVVGAGLPHLPAALAASQVLRRAAVPLRRARPARPRRRRAALHRSRRATRTPTSTPTALDALYPATDGYPYFVQAYGKAAWDVAPPRRSPRPTSPWPPRRPRPSSPSASSAPATTGPRPPSASTCAPMADARRGAAATTPVATAGGRRVARPQAAVAVPRARRR